MVKNNQKRPEGAFTLIELLVVISIISLLSSVVLSSLGGAREDARQSAAMAELDSLRTGIELMLNDTGKWPNGCPTGQISNPEVNLNNAQAGLLEVPAAADQGGGCIWTSDDVAEWNGPYVNSNDLLDGWDRPYRFDPDFYPYRNCSTKADEPGIVAIFSYGPAEVIDGYGCNTVFLNLY